MTELDPRQLGSSGQIELAEHSIAGRAKKVVDGPVMFPDKAANDDTENKAPVIANLSASHVELVLVQNRNYRLIADVDCWFKQSAGGSAAVANTDIYLPAKTAIIINTSKWVQVSAIAAGAGKIQATELK
jgi:hypothetical protein